MLSFDELAGTLRTTKDRVLQGVNRSPAGESAPADGEGGGATSSGAEAEPASQPTGTNTDGRSAEESNTSQPSSDRRTPSPRNKQQASSHDSILSPIRKIDLSKGSREGDNPS